jgi:hypothetical protein
MCVGAVYLSGTHVRKQNEKPDVGEYSGIKGHAAKAGGAAPHTFQLLCRLLKSILWSSSFIPNPLFICTADHLGCTVPDSRVGPAPNTLSSFGFLDRRGTTRSPIHLCLTIMHFRSCSTCRRDLRLHISDSHVVYTPTFSHGGGAS